MTNWLNYHHLYYFWIIAQEESVSVAAKKLRLAQPTLSAQLKQLEENLGTQLFDRIGRNLSLTENGKLVFKYADNIFTLGKELQAVVKGETEAFQDSLRIGITVSLPKLVVHRALLPIYSAKMEIKIECFEGKRSLLLAELASHDLDMVLADAPFASEVAVKAYNHQIGSSGITLCGTTKLINKFKGNSLKRFEGAPFVLPTRNTMLRRVVDTWFDKNHITPKIVGEFEDSALLKSFGSDGLGFFPVASVVEKEVESHYRVKKVLQMKGAKEDIFAISLERKVTHPAIKLIAEAAKRNFR